MPLAKPAKPDAITAVPTPVPLRTDRANFAARGDAMMGWFPTGIAGVNTTLTYFGNAVNFVEQEANEAEASATAAAASNAAAAVNAAAAAASAGATVWVTGTTYAAGNVRYSPTNYQTYRDTVGGVSNTDPASDTTGRWISAMLPSAEAIGVPAMPPTAVFNFASGVIDRRFVESRSTARTRVGKFGTSEAVAAGVATVDYDVVTRECLGYIAESAATYIALNSADFSGWGASDTGGGFGASVAAPDGTLTAKTWTFPSSTAAFAYGQKIASADASGQAVFEIWIRRQSGAGAFALAISDVAAGGNSGAVTVDSTWRKVSFTSSTLTNTGSIGVGFAGTAGDVFELWHPQLTLGTTAGRSYESTVGSNVVTVGGGLVMDLTAHTEIINPRGFTFVAAFDYPANEDVAKFICAANDGTENSNCLIDMFNDTLYAQAIIGGVDSGSKSQLSLVAAGVRTVVAASFGDGEVRLAQRGGSVVTAALTAALPSFTRLSVGAVPSDSVNYRPGKPIEFIAIFPRACNANELLALVNNF